MARESKDGKPTRAAARSEPVQPVPEETPDSTQGAEAAAGTKKSTAIDEVIAAIEAARDKVMSDEVKSLTKLGIPRAMAYQMVAARFHQNVVTDGEGGSPEFESSHWNDR
jgi:hypothetical protein